MEEFKLQRYRSFNKFITIYCFDNDSNEAMLLDDEVRWIFKEKQNIKERGKVGKKRWELIKSIGRRPQLKVGKVSERRRV